jgi:hypothetical protein
LAGTSEQFENDGRFDREEATEGRSICEAYLPSSNPALKKIGADAGHLRRSGGADAGQMRIVTG